MKTESHKKTENLLVKRAISILGNQQLLAEAVGVKQPTVHRWLYGRTIPGGRAFLIEVATNGIVKKEDLNRDFFEGFKN
jgi:DNA-binding transcriptional regulator YdaS (Cro superfamily)